MNKQRRGLLLCAVRLLDKALESIGAAKEMEEEAYENMPEGLQCSERGETMAENIEDMDTAYEAVDGAMTSLKDIIERR